VDDARGDWAARQAAGVNLAARLCRHHHPQAGAVVLGTTLLRSQMVRSTAMALADAMPADIQMPAEPSSADAGVAEAALLVRELADRLDLTRRHGLALSAVVCRLGPTVWLPADLIWRDAVHREAQARGLRLGLVHLLTDHGWRDDHGGAAATPRLPRPSPSWW
jgi:hypothetical protein